MRGVNHTEKRAVYFRPRCKLWTCPYCAEVNKKLWTARAYYGAEVLGDTDGKSQSNLITFLTLTSHAKLGPEKTIEVFSSAWNVLRGRARRRAPQGQYILIPERHKDGRLHAHAVTTFHLGQRFWKDASAEVGLGYMAEEEIARTPGGAAFYVAKYLSKALTVTDWPKYWRRVRTSRRWPKLPPLPENEDWRFLTLPQDTGLTESALELANGGYEVMFLNHAEAWDYVGRGTKNSPCK